MVDRSGLHGRGDEFFKEAPPPALKKDEQGQEAGDGPECLNEIGLGKMEIVHGNLLRRLCPKMAANPIATAALPAKNP